MKCVNREGEIIKSNDTQNRILSLLYNTPPGRRILSVLVKPGLSEFAGDILDSSISKFLIKPFIKNNRIDMSEYIEDADSFSSFNDFFTRKIKSNARCIDMNPDSLISPCDARLSVYSIEEDSSFQIKNTEYTLTSLLQSEKLAKKYMGGKLLLFRLSVDDYHRYIFPDAGIKSGYKKIKGVFHTVNPIAGDVFPIYTENTREYCLIKSENFGSIIMMEVGAMLVGRIANYSGKLDVSRGEEKGRFEFGGSTIVMCLKKDAAVIDSDIVENSKNNIETLVKLGQCIGHKKGL